MKKWTIFALALLCGVPVAAQAPQKRSCVYAVKGADTLRLDTYEAGTAGNRAKPCMLFVFGGGFVSGARDDARYLPYFEYYAQQGYLVVSIDYRLGLKKAMQRGPLDERTFPAAWISTLAMATEDLYDATRYVAEHADAWGIAEDRIVACGSSAGAITVLMGEYGICNGDMLARRLPAGFNYAGVISFAGAIFDTAEELDWRKTPVPIMLFHGDADRNVPYGEIRYEGVGFYGSRYIADQLTALKAPHYFYSVANTDHVTATQPMFDNRYEIDTFLEKLVFGKQPLIIDTYVNSLDKPEVSKTFTLMDYIQANFGN